MDQGDAEAIRVERARPADIDGILALQADNLPERGGSLSSALPRALLEELATGPMPLVVARHGDRVVGYLVTTSKQQTEGLPIVAAMLAAYAGAPDAYVSGPICVDRAARGQGLARRLFETARELLGGREAVNFIRADNVASLRAHEKIGMRRVAGFRFGAVDYAVLSLA